MERGGGESDGGVFLSTLSLRRATDNPLRHSKCRKLSIHALLAESDGIYLPDDTFFNNFLSTLSLRRATQSRRGWTGNRTFLSTLSLRRATRGCAFYYPIFALSIHALLAESDDRPPGTDDDRAKPFYPRSPCGERRRTWHRQNVWSALSIHALLAESDTASSTWVTLT